MSTNAALALTTLGWLFTACFIFSSGRPDYGAPAAAVMAAATTAYLLVNIAIRG